MTPAAPAPRSLYVAGASSPSFRSHRRARALPGARRSGYPQRNFERRRGSKLPLPWEDRER